MPRRRGLSGHTAAQAARSGSARTQKPAQSQRAPPPEKVRGDAAGELADQTDAVKDPLRKPDLPKTVPPAGRTTHTASVMRRQEAKENA